MIDKILDHRTMRMSRQNKRAGYLVHGKGKSKVDATWERDLTEHS